MRAQCDSEGGAFEVAACKGVADVYYRAVVEFGTKRAAEIEEALRLKERDESDGFGIMSEDEEESVGGVPI